MILLLAYDNPSIFGVIRWLDYFNKKWVRIKPNDNIELINLVIHNGQFDYELYIPSQNKKIIYSEITASFVWHGRLDIEVHLGATFLENYPLISENIFRQTEVLREFIIYSLELKRCLGKYYNQNINKLKVLSIAQEVGLKIPDTKVITQKNALVNESKEGGIITKNIYESFVSFYKGELYGTYTESINESSLELLPEEFYPSLIQNELQKTFEIRTFYLQRECFSMAIFSQLDESTKTDYRKRNLERPNRTIPFTLPLDISNKIIELMKRLNLNNGSIDFVYTKSNEFIFLEVNPVGQFGALSGYCNYNLEKKIAEYLINS